MDDFIDSFIASSTWSHRNASSGASWSGTSLSPTNVLLAESVEQYGEVEKPSVSMMASNHIVGNSTGEDLNIQGHDGTYSIFVDGSMKYENLKELYSDERLSHQNVCSQPSNAITMNSDAQVSSFSLHGVGVSTTAAAPFESTLPHSALAMASSIESNSSQLSAFPQSLGDAHSITSVPAIWSSLYSSVSSLMGQENLPDFGYQGNENNADMLGKISLGNGRSHLDRLSAASMPIKDKNQLHALSSFSDEQWIVGALQPQKLSPPSEGHITSHQINNSSCTQSQAVPANGTGCNGAVKPRVRARRGQATDPHSIAERLRREKIAERMKNLQELVPNSNKTDKASMLDEIIDYVKFLQLQVKVLSMSRLGAAGAVVPLLTDSQAEGSGSLLLSSSVGQGGSDNSDSEDNLAFELEVVKLMETNVTTAMQYLQNKGFCLMPIALATAISSQKGSSMAAIPPDRRKPAASHRLTLSNGGSTGSNCNENEGTMVKEEAHQLNDKARESNGKAN